MLWLGLLADDVFDAGAELLVAAGVVGAVWLWLEVVPGLPAWCPARAKARAAPPAPSTMATPRTNANRAERDLFAGEP